MVIFHGDENPMVETVKNRPQKTNPRTAYGLIWNLTTWQKKLEDVVIPKKNWKQSTVRSREAFFTGF